MSHLVKSAIRGGRFINKAVCFLAVFSALVIPESNAQTTVTYTMQDANFPTQFNNGGDFFNNGSTELGMWANSGAKQTVGWENFSTTGAAGGTARNLQVGDVFITTVAATRAFGQIGFSLNAGGTQGSSYANNISGSRMYISTDNYAAWSVKGLSGGATSSLSYVPLQDTFKDYRFTVRITSQTTADVYLTVDGTDYRAYNLALAGSAGANISAFSIFGSDMWDGNSNENAFWKQTTSVQNSGRVELGYFASGATSTTPGLITDGLAANSTSVTSANAVFIGGAAGSQVNLNQANTYTGQTTVNSAARLEVQNASALGGTSNGTTVSDGGALSLYQATGGITVANEALNLAGTGVSGANGALRNTGGNNAWNGTVTLGANTRINADTSGSSGSLTIGGNISGGSNVLFMGAQGASGANTGGDITMSGVISGAGATHNSTITSLYKDGAGTLTLSGANTYSGATAVNAGLLKILSGGSISSSSTTVNNGGALDVGGTAGSVQVNSGGLLKGSGSAGAVTLQSGSLLNPGNSPGTLTAASATILGGSTYNWEISALTGTAGTTWDLFSVGGLLNMDGVTSANKWNLVVTGDSGFAGWTGTDSYSYVFAQAASVSGFSSTVGTDVTSLFNITTSGITSVPNASFNANGDFKVVVGSSNGFTTLNLMAVPEPSSGSLLLAGIGSLIVLRRFRKKA
jgi:autotransporter-associated beta strand protein